jgi:hypothetical protein
VLMRGSERWGTKQDRALAHHQRRALRQALGLAQHPENPALVTRPAPPRRSAASAREFFQGKKDLTYAASSRCGACAACSAARA